MDYLNKNFQEYAENYSTDEDELLKKINRETHLKVPMPRMLSGHLQGIFLKMFSTALQPKCILEIGTYTGYSGICLAKGLSENGRLITIDINDELENMVRGYFKESGLERKIDYKLGNALDIIPELDIQPDLVFIDADKKNYLNYYKMIIDKLRPGGFILVDNVWWSGKVLNEKKDKDTTAIHEFNEFVHHDKRVENFLLPIRDGIMILRKLA
ncbi:MAG: O-methyltransferase [Chitinophagaceae bacterium]|nr:MAG: O-methyltransferase [Chitinophagaceae bacterium]